MISLKEIVANLLDSSDASSHSYRRLYNLGVFGMKTEFNLDVTGGIKTVLLDVNANKTVELPCDYIRYNKIGVVNQSGEFTTFKCNDQLTNYHQAYFNSTTRLAALPTLPTLGAAGYPDGGLVDYNALYYLNYWFSGTSYQLFGIGSGTANVGEYKVDEQARIILFDPFFHWSQVLLEYLSDGMDEENDDYQVDIRAAEAVKSYLRWQNAIDQTKKYSQGQIRDYRSQYFNEKRKSKMRLNPIVLNELQNAERRSWKLAPKA